MEVDRIYRSFVEVVMVQQAATYRIKQYLKQEKIPLRIEQLPVLMCVQQLGILSQQEIAGIVGRDKSSVQRTVMNLISKDVLMTRQDQIDKRKNLISLTPLGKELARKVARFEPAADTYEVQQLSASRFT